MVYICHIPSELIHVHVLEESSVETHSMLDRHLQVGFVE